MGDGLLSLNWNNHGATFCHTLALLRGKEQYTDATLSCDGKFYQVHKLVLGTCSDYFADIFQNTPCKHPVIVLRDIHSQEIESLLNYMYRGIVSVAQKDLSRLIKVAELLQIKGLAVPDEPPVTKSSSKRTDTDRYNADNLCSSSGGGSPYPKRRKRDSDNHSSTSSIPSSAQQQQQQSLHPRNEEPVTKSEDRDSRHAEDRLHDKSPDRVSSPVMVDIEETLIKEEIPDDQEQDDIIEDYSEMGLDPENNGASGDMSQEAAAGLMIPKFDELRDKDQGDSSLPLADPVVEALAGPSGLQGWADEGDMSRGGLPLAEGFSGGESQDMSSVVGTLPQPSSSSSSSSQQPQQMVGESTLGGGIVVVESNSSRTFWCSSCNFSTTHERHLQAHMSIHTPTCRPYSSRPYCCPYCLSRFADGTTLKNHVRRHTGERPFKCPYCPFSAIQRTNLKRHVLARHKKNVSSQNSR